MTIDLKILHKIINLAGKRPRHLMGLRYYLIVSDRLGIAAPPAPGAIVLEYGGREARPDIVTPENAHLFHCRVKPGTRSIPVATYIRSLTYLLTGETIPDPGDTSPAQKAHYFCQRGIEILTPHFLDVPAKR